jgi:GTPase SAR1 family protein
MSGLNELTFVGCFWRLAADGDPKAQRIAAGLPPEALTDGEMARSYSVLAQRVAAGQDVGMNNPDVMTPLLAVSPQIASNLWDTATLNGHLDITPHVRWLHTGYQARRQAQLFAAAARELEGLAASDPAAALKVAEGEAMRSLTLGLETAAQQAPQTRKEITDAELAVLESGGLTGISWPYPKMQRILGPILPGRLYGITAFPNCGKSTLLANLFRGFTVRGYPCLVAPTEMRTDWLRRVWAAHAGVPQEIAENQLWSAASEEVARYLGELWGCTAHEVDGILATHRGRYEDAVRLFEGLDWEVINKSDLTIEQIISSFRVLRRRYPGQHVIGMVDHMHDLRYPQGETDRWVGQATRALREFCKDDPAFSCIVLFQPKKAQNEQDQFKPIRANEIRGQVAQVLDVHLSIYRRYVKTSPVEKTPWGSFACLTNERGLPEGAKPEDGGAKVDDEHMYLKPDKRRIGGEGPSFMLDMLAPSGLVYERDRRREVRGAAA